MVPSHSESFGLVAVEAQAVGTPVVAARVGGLQTAVDDGRSGLLVDGHDPAVWSDALASLLADPARRRELATGAVRHGRTFGWADTARRLLDVYADALTESSVRLSRPALRRLAVR